MTIIKQVSCKDDKQIYEVLQSQFTHGGVVWPPHSVWPPKPDS